MIRYCSFPLQFLGIAAVSVFSRRSLDINANSMFSMLKHFDSL